MPARAEGEATRTRVAHSLTAASQLSHSPPCSTLVAFAQGGSCPSQLASAIPREPLPAATPS